MKKIKMVLERIPKPKNPGQWDAQDWSYFGSGVCGIIVIAILIVVEII